ncbi:MAG: phage virion morphogenesis protein [Hyphomicrobiales bacterium]|nr:phage virion morphogenesis protein [Hyphomicrobiales bacterium]
MAAVYVEIKIPNDPKGAGAAIARLAEKLGNPVGLLKAIGEAELQVTQDRFASKTAPDGTRWADNAPLTLMLAGGKGSMLKRSGGLYGSLSYTVSGTTLSLGPNKVYAAVQQFGATIKSKTGGPLRIPVPAGTMMAQGKGPSRRTNAPGAIFVMSVTIPARPYIGVGPADEQAIMEAAQDWFAAP